MIRKDNDFIALGEGHLLGARKPRYEILLSKILQAGFKPVCITLEQTTDIQNLIDSTIKLDVIDNDKFNENANLGRDGRMVQLLFYSKQQMIPLFAIDHGKE